VISRTGTWQQAELEARVPLITRTTLADRVGPWPEYVIVAATAAALVLAAWPLARRRIFLTPGTTGDNPQ
jgi:apolipoprotein N-acyltransferase